MSSRTERCASKGCEPSQLVIPLFLQQKPITSIFSVQGKFNSFTYPQYTTTSPTFTGRRLSVSELLRFSTIDGEKETFRAPKAVYEVPPLSTAVRHAPRVIPGDRLQPLPLYTSLFVASSFCIQHLAARAPRYYRGMRRLVRADVCFTTRGALDDRLFACLRTATHSRSEKITV